jgi:hypothetical protein
MQSGEKTPSDSSKLTLFIFNDWTSLLPSYYQAQATCSSNGGNVDCNLHGVATVFDSTTSGWINLTGGSWQDSNPFSNQLISWIQNGFATKLQPGAYASSSIVYSSNVYNAISSNKIYIFPVSKSVSFNNSKWSYRRTGSFSVNGFSAFYVTCVDSFGAFDSPTCPGAKAFYNANMLLSWLYPYDTIEGYFVSNYPITGTSSGGLDAGLHIISLTQ